MEHLAQFAQSAKQLAQIQQRDADADTHGRDVLALYDAVERLSAPPRPTLTETEHEALTEMVRCAYDLECWDKRTDVERALKKLNINP